MRTQQGQGNDKQEGHEEHEDNPVFLRWLTRLARPPRQFSCGRLCSPVRPPVPKALNVGWVEGGWRVWQPMLCGFQQRFVHITELNGGILAQMPLTTGSTMGSDGHVVDQLQIPNIKIYRGAWIGTGFWSEAAGSMPVATPETDRVAESVQGADTHNFRFEFDTIKQRNWR